MIDTVLILLGASLSTTAFVQRLGLSPIIGLILMGIQLGPNGMGWVLLSKSIYKMAEIGVVFPMFTIRLEFSLSRLLAFQGRELPHRRDRLQVIKIPRGAYAEERQLKQFEPNKHHVTVIAVRHHGIRGTDPQRLERYLTSGKM